MSANVSASSDNEPFVARNSGWPAMRRSRNALLATRSVLVVFVSAVLASAAARVGQSAAAARGAARQRTRIAGRLTKRATIEFELDTGGGALFVART